MSDVLPCIACQLCRQGTACCMSCAMGLHTHVQVKVTRGKKHKTGKEVLTTVVYGGLMVGSLDKVEILLPSIPKMATV